METSLGGAGPWRLRLSGSCLGKETHPDPRHPREDGLPFVYSLGMVMTAKTQPSLALACSMD